MLKKIIIIFSTQISLWVFYTHAAVVKKNFPEFLKKPAWNHLREQTETDKRNVSAVQPVSLRLISKSFVAIAMWNGFVPPVAILLLSAMCSGIDKKKEKKERNLGEFVLTVQNESSYLHIRKCSGFWDIECFAKVFITLRFLNISQ